MSTWATRTIIGIGSSGSSSLSFFPAFDFPLFFSVAQALFATAGQDLHYDDLHVQRALFFCHQLLFLTNPSNIADTATLMSIARGEVCLEARA
jgi:hypothetical protein